MHNSHFEKASFPLLTVKKRVEKNDTYPYACNYNKEWSVRVNLIHDVNLCQGEECTFV
jgi:hypothetical protein